MAKAKPPITKYFDQGVTPTISVIYQAPTLLPNYYKGLPGLVAAMQKTVDTIFAPVWGARCDLVMPKNNKIIPGTWAAVFTDTVDEANALGYHDPTPEGLPLSKIFVKTTMQAREEVSVTFSHEIYEMLIDPALQMMVMNYRNGTIYAYEVADSVERETFKVNGIPMSNFQFPSWFESFRKRNTATKKTKFDYLGTCKEPFEIRPGGYMSVFRNGNWTEIFGSKPAAKKFGSEPHPRARMRRERSEQIRLAFNETNMTEFIA